jgi:hypothetical protein
MSYRNTLARWSAGRRSHKSLPPVGVEACLCALPMSYRNTASPACWSAGGTAARLNGAAAWLARPDRALSCSARRRNKGRKGAQLSSGSGQRTAQASAAALQP